MKKYILLTILVIFLLKPSVGFAISNLYFEPISNQNGNNESYLINLNIDTGNEYINAIQARLIYPKDIIEIKEIRDGNSGINFWLEKPKIEKDGIITFSGITPGGFLGKKLIFSILVNKKSEIKGEIKLDNVSVFKNSENGELAQFKTENLQLPVINFKKQDLITIDLSSDKNPPQEFTPFILRDKENELGSDNVLVFSTQDKESGIEHYEVKYGYFGKYIKTDSPYILKKGYLYNKIYVKAIDKAMNERVVEIYPSTLVKLYHQYGIIVIILLVILIIKRRKWLNFIV